MAINQDIFFDGQDRQEYLERVKRYKDELEFILCAYVLMANHHLIMETPYASIYKIMQRITLTYTQYFNKKYGKVGHLFQGRYKAFLCERDEYLLSLVRYIHLNPREILIHDGVLEKYAWSSYPEYLGITNKEICEKMIILQQFCSADLAQSYKKFVENITAESESLQLKDLFIELE